MNFKSNPVLWGGVALLVYGLYMLMGDGADTKSLAATIGGAYLLLQNLSPVIAAKVKDYVITKVKKFFADIKDVVDGDDKPVMDMNALSVDAENSPGPEEPEYRTDSFPKFFKAAEYEALAYLAVEAAKAGDLETVEQLRLVNDKFFTISVNRVRDENSDAQIA